uniref:NADH-ubiquinone oxidoreductase chain 2 n=1 Tax=Oxyeleotris marmorata TaxID=86250 RepID=A0A068AAP6_9TELE|nr:NADH dehydrogenase subunit 2 [Oxyeleotris marmorata]
MTPFITALLLFGLGLGTTLTFASSHWLLAWMGLEINTLAIIPLMAQHHHPRAIEATTKYFLTQATAAATLLFASITNAWITGQWNIQLMTHPLPTTMIILALSLKIGLAPLHTWLPEVLQGLDLTTGLILSTWQKLAPFALLLQIPLSDQTILILLALTSTLVGGWGGLNQTQLRKNPSMLLKLLIWLNNTHYSIYPLTCPSRPSHMPHHNIFSLPPTQIKWHHQYQHTSNFLSQSSPYHNNHPNDFTFPRRPPPIHRLHAQMTNSSKNWLNKTWPSPQHWAALTALLSLYFYLRLSYAMTLTLSPNTLAGTTPWRLPSSQPSLPLSSATLLAILLLPLAPTITALLTL